MVKETEYRCYKCGKEFLSRGSLGRHKAAHTRWEQKSNRLHATLNDLPFPLPLPTHHHHNIIQNNNIIQSLLGETTTIMSKGSLGSNFELQETPKIESLQTEKLPRNLTDQTNSTSTGSGSGGNGGGGLWAYPCNTCGQLFMANKTLLGESSTRIYYCGTCTNTKPTTGFH